MPDDDVFSLRLVYIKSLYLFKSNLEAKFFY